MTAETGHGASLPADVRRLLNRYTNEVSTVFGSNLRSVFLYGSLVRGDYIPGRSNINLCVLLGSSEPEGFEPFASLHRRWAKEKIIVPLFLTDREFADSIPYFPLEYLEMEEHHLVLSGYDPFATVQMDLSYLGFQCAQEMRSNLVRLRQRFVEGGGRPEAVSVLLPLSLTALLPCLRGVLRLRGAPTHGNTENLLRTVESRLDVDPDAFREVSQLKRGMISPGRLEVPRLFARYTKALEDVIARTAEFHANQKR